VRQSIDQDLKLAKPSETLTRLLPWLGASRPAEIELDSSIFKGLPLGLQEKLKALKALDQAYVAALERFRPLSATRKELTARHNEVREDLATYQHLLTLAQKQ